MPTINMQTMRYLNLLDRSSKVKTRICFEYNNTLFFAVPRKLVSKAIGPDASNIKKMQDQLRKKIKIIKIVDSKEQAPEFIEEIVSPTKFKSAEIKEKELIITAGTTQNKASLIGRNKRRLEELKKITEDLFNLELKII